MAPTNKRKSDALQGLPPVPTRMLGRRRKSEILQPSSPSRTGTFGRRRTPKKIAEENLVTMGSYSIARDTFDKILPEALAAAKHVQMAKLRQSRALDTSDEISNLSLERQKTFGTFAISDLRIPLVWNENHCHRYAVFGAIICGDYCIDTDIISLVDRTMPDICFEKPYILEKVPPDFECKLSVFVADLGSDPNLVSVRKRLHQTLRSSFRSTTALKKKFDKTVEFTLGATATFTLNDCSPDISSYDLQLEPVTLPFFGHVCCRLSIRPHCLSDVFESSKSVKCCEKKVKIRMSGFKGRLEKDGREIATFQLRENTSVKAGPVSKNQIVISCNTDEDVTIGFSSSELYQQWLSVLLERVILAKRWKHAADVPMDLPLTQAPPTPTPSGMSLYEATPIQLNRRQIRPVMEIFSDQNGTPMSSTTSLASLASSYYAKSGSVVSLQPKLRRRGTLSGWSSTRSFLRFSR